MEKKLTKREIINSMLTIDAIISNEIYVNFLKHELELLDAKTANRKETAKQKENRELQNVVYSVLCSNSGNMMSIKEICANDEALKNLSSNKVSAMLKVLIDSGSVNRIKNSKGTFYIVT